MTAGLRAVADSARTGVRAVSDGARSGVRAAYERVLDIAPRIPVRDLETLRRHLGDLDGEELADALAGSPPSGSRCDATH